MAFLSSNIWTINGTASNPKIFMLGKICDGFGITLAEFFSSNIFNNLDKETK